MAEFCKECFKEINPEVEDNNIVLSEDIYFCERCGNVTNVVIGVK